MGKNGFNQGKSKSSSLGKRILTISFLSRHEKVNLPVTVKADFTATNFLSRHKKVNLPVMVKADFTATNFLSRHKKVNLPVMEKADFTATNFLARHSKVNLREIIIAKVVQDARVFFLPP